MIKNLSLTFLTNGPRVPRLSASEKIDVCRGLFAFLVVSAHALELAWSLDPSAPGHLHWLTHRLLAYATGTGLYWVMGFFVISGYCIHLSVQRLIDSGAFPLRTYLIARLTRIVPLYYIALLFTLMVEWWIAMDRPPCWPNGLNGGVLGCQLLLIQNFTQTFGSFAPSWSITNEVFYYIFYGLLASILVSRTSRLATIGMGVCMAAGISMQLIYRLGHRSSLILGTGLLFGLGINWFLGALVAERSEPLGRDRRIQSIARFWPLIVTAAVALWCSQHVHLEYVYLSTGFAFTFMLVRFLGDDLRQGAPGEGLSVGQRSVVTLLGLSSYPTYLFHGPILMLVGWANLRWNLNGDWRMIWAVATVVAVACGVALGYFAERPILAWRTGLLKRLKDSRPTPMPSRLKGPVLGAPQ
jgi:peptidoglycan/LPS O-acetylase OafA/YrhL